MRDDERYAHSFGRNLGILHAGEQARLRGASVAIAGLGGIGGSTLVALARMGVGRFRLADFDTFELANINRQYGARVDTVGVPKVQVLADEVRRINPEAAVEVFPHAVDEENADAFLAGADVAVDAIDFYAIEGHVRFHRAARCRGLYVVMGSPVGFSACLQVFDPRGMGLEEYCDIQPWMEPLEKQLRYACGLVPALAHLDYFDVSAGASNTDFLAGTGPSLACACGLAAALVATEVALLLTGRRPPRCIPHSFQFDPYTYRYEPTVVPGGMANFDPEPALARITDRSSLVPQVLDLFYRKRRSRKAPVNGVELYYREEGSGPPLLLISPLGADSGFWARQTQALARQFRVVSFDNRGSGASSSGADGCSTAMLADDAAALLEYLGIERAHVLGLALGGAVAQELVLRHSERVAGLVLASSYACPDAHLRDVTARWRETATRQGMAALFDTCVPDLFSAAYAAESQGELEKVKTFFRLTLQAPECFRAQSRAGVDHDARARLSRVRSPALVVHGGGDTLVSPALAAELAAAIPAARLLTLNGAPHFLTWEHADAFNHAVCEFLTGLPEVRVGTGSARPPAGHGGQAHAREFAYEAP